MAAALTPIAWPPFVALKSATRIGISKMMIHAPSAAFVAATMQRTTNVAMAPTAFIAAPLSQPCARSRNQCRTIPDCDRVNEMKTPIM